MVSGTNRQIPRPLQQPTHHLFFDIESCADTNPPRQSHLVAIAPTETRHRLHAHDLNPTQCRGGPIPPLIALSRTARRSRTW